MNNRVKALAERECMEAEKFKSAYLYPAKKYHVSISEAVYDYTQHSKPPEDGKRAKVRPA
jgi:hypothetical protein